VSEQARLGENARDAEIRKLAGSIKKLHNKTQKGPKGENRLENKKKKPIGKKKPG